MIDDHGQTTFGMHHDLKETLALHAVFDAQQKAQEVGDDGQRMVVPSIVACYRQKLRQSLTSIGVAIRNHLKRQKEENEPGV